MCGYCYYNHILYVCLQKRENKKQKKMQAICKLFEGKDFCVLFSMIVLKPRLYLVQNRW